MFQASKSAVFLLLLISLATLASCRPHAAEGNSNENKEVEQKHTRIVQNPFAPFAIPILLSDEDEEDTHGKKEDKPKNSSEKKEQLHQQTL